VANPAIAGEPTEILRQHPHAAPYCLRLCTALCTVMSSAGEPADRSPQSGLEDTNELRCPLWAVDERVAVALPAVDGPRCDVVPALTPGLVGARCQRAAPAGWWLGGVRRRPCCYTFGVGRFEAFCLRVAGRHVWRPGKILAGRGYSLADLAIAYAGYLSGVLIPGWLNTFDKSLLV
jgi:hypothetical protein